MRALVTGGTGFVGSAVVRALISAGHEVTCLVRATSNRANLRGLAVRFAEGDLGDRASLESACRGQEHLYHVAAHYSTLPEEAELMFAVNVQGTRAILESALAANVRRIVHTSTIGTIGRSLTSQPPTEDDLLTDLAAVSQYARSKLQGEEVALGLARDGAPIMVVNPCGPVGVGDVGPSSTGARIVAYLEGRVPSYTPGGINFVAVADVAAGHLLAAERARPGRRYILGNRDGNLTLSDFYRFMERASGQRPPSARLGVSARWRAIVRRALGSSAGVAASARGYQPLALTADPSRAINELGLPQTPLERAFAEAVDWFRQNGYVHERRRAWVR